MRSNDKCGARKAGFRWMGCGRPAPLYFLRARDWIITTYKAEAKYSSSIFELEVYSDV